MHFLQRLIFLIVLCVFAVPLIVTAQAPSRSETQQLVLDDMSQRTGQTLTINSMSYQQWFYGSYDYLHGLGCPLAPATAPTGGQWQRFEFTYSGFVYIYMVSENLQSLILCNEPEAPTSIPPTATLIPTLTPFVPTTTGGGQSGGGTVEPFAGCNLPRRLVTGQNGRVTPGDPNWIHSEPDRTSTKVGEIPGGETFTIIGEPTCDRASGMVYWRVDYNGITGWTSEGLNGEYWLEPAAQGFSPENVAAANVNIWINDFPDDANILIDISPAGDRIVYGWNSDVRVTNIDGTVISAFVADGQVMLVGFTASGSAYYGTDTGQVTYISDIVLQIGAEFRHDSAIRDIVITNDERLIVVAEEDGTVTFWETGDNVLPLRTIQFEASIGSLEFSDDNTILFIRDVDDYLILTLVTQ